MNSIDFAKECLTKLEDKKALDGVILELKGHTVVADYFVIATGTSDRHAKALADELKQHSKPFHMDGYDAGDWVVLDYADVIVHIFKQEAREFYDLERLWRNCKKI